jgi:hypothetical protein
MDPFAYHMPWVHFILLLAEKYSLSIAETLSLQIAFKVVPNSSDYFCLATMILLFAASPGSLHCHHHGFGFGFGYLVSHFMFEYFEK